MFLNLLSLYKHSEIYAPSLSDVDVAVTPSPQLQGDLVKFSTPLVFCLH